MTYKRRPNDIHNLPEVSKHRTDLRRILTPAEARLWTLIKGSRLDGRKFRRQHRVFKNEPFVLEQIRSEFGWNKKT